MADASENEVVVARRRHARATEPTGPHPCGVGKYDKEIIKYAHLCYKPGQIADLLQSEHGVSPAVANRKSVKSRLRYIKKNSLAPLPPVNDTATMGAELSKCAASCFGIIYFIVFFF